MLAVQLNFKKKEVYFNTQATTIYFSSTEIYLTKFAMNLDTPVFSDRTYK